MRYLGSFLCLCVMYIASGVTGLHLPDYIKPCSKKAKNFGECAVEHAKLAIPHLIKGDKRLKIPPLDPLRITSVDLKGASNFRLKIKNVEVHGLSSAIPLSFDLDFEKRHGTMVFKAARVTILGDYTMTGKLVFPINGFGPCNVTLDGGIYEYTFDWILEERNNLTYGRIINSKYHYELQKVVYDFKNLFSGDERISQQLNQVINENWKIVDQDLSESVKSAFLAIQNSILENLYTIIPYNELFVD